MNFNICHMHMVWSEFDATMNPAYLFSLVQTATGGVMML